MHPDRRFKIVQFHLENIYLSCNQEFRMEHTFIFKTYWHWWFIILMTW